MIKKELEVLDELKRRDDIIVTSVDKDAPIVIQDVQQNIKEAGRQLNNIRNYRQLPNDPTKMNNDTVNKTFKRFENEHLIKDKVAERLIIENVTIQSLKFTKNESLVHQLLVQLIATFQKYWNIYID